jgi:dipeptidyl-peptidase-3
MMNGLLTQLARIELGKNIEEAHMRNRALIANWVLEHGQQDKVVELIQQENKTYVLINDYIKMRTLIGELLAEIQRIKSEGDFEGAKSLVEKYAVKVNPDTHKEILERYATLKIAPYKGFVNPYYQVEKDDSGNIIDIVPVYTEGYAEQMLRYAKEYSHLPTYN